MSRCKKCKHWEFTTTIGSIHKPIWHCRFGFSPSEDCQDMAEYDIQCIRNYYREHPEYLQLQLNF